MRSTTVSVAVIVWLPAVFKTTLLNVCEPASPAVNGIVRWQAGRQAVGIAQVDRPLIKVRAARHRVVVGIECGDRHRA